MHSVRAQDIVDVALSDRNEVVDVARMFIEISPEMWLVDGYIIYVIYIYIVIILSYIILYYTISYNIILYYII